MASPNTVITLIYNEQHNPPSSSQLIDPLFTSGIAKMASKHTSFPILPSLSVEKRVVIIPGTPSGGWSPVKATATTLSLPTVAQLHSRLYGKERTKLRTPSGWSRVEEADDECTKAKDLPVSIPHTVEALMVDERGCAVLEDSCARLQIPEHTKSTVEGTTSKARNLHNSQNKNLRGLRNDVSFKTTIQNDANPKCSTAPKKLQFADNVLQ